MFAPQRPGKDQLTMLGRMEQICRRGRVRGFRPWLITQRPASLHKSVLSQANTLVAMQLTAPQDRDALGDWIEGQADRNEGKRILAELPKLKKGEGFVWAPHHGILERVRFPAIGTFDSGRTPEDGATPPRVELAKIDLEELIESLEDAATEAAENDPKQLRERVRELEEQLAGAQGKDSGHTKAEVNAEYARGREEGWEAAMTKAAAAVMEAQSSGYLTGIKMARAALDTVPGPIAVFGDAPPVSAKRMPNDIQLAPSHVARPAHREAQANENQRAARRVDPMVGTAPALGNSGKRRMLIALAQNPKGLTYTKLSLLTGISQSGGTWRTYLGELRGTGLVEGGSMGITITPEGLKALGSYEPLPTGRALLDYWRGRLGNSGKRSIFDVLVEAYPRGMAPADVATATGIAIAGGTWRTYLGELRGLELIVGRETLSANGDLFR